MDAITWHWNGTAWTQAPNPAAGELSDVDMIASNDGVAVGENGIILRWNGSAWQSMTSPTTDWRQWRASSALEWECLDIGCQSHHRRHL
jgi:hypothetical protein